MVQVHQVQALHDLLVKSAAEGGDPQAINPQNICTMIEMYNAFAPLIGMLFGEVLPTIPLPSFCTVPTPTRAPVSTP